MHAVAHDVVAEIIGLSENKSRLAAAARHPNREATRMMIPTKVVCFDRPLRVGSAAKLTAPNDQRVFEQAALFQIHHQRCARLIGLLALGADSFWKTTVVIPVTVIELNETAAALGEATREQTVVCIG